MRHRTHFQFVSKALSILISISMIGLFLGVSARTFSVKADGIDSPTPTISLSPVTPVESSSTYVPWPSTPADASQLATDQPLTLLAGKLIFHGLVDASSCADGGMMRSGAASPCGMTVTQNAVILWQNQFDQDILKASLETGVPAVLLKNLILKESQFWPATYHNPLYGGEYGLGHITNMGADTLLRWNWSFEQDVCSQVYANDTCKKQFAFLTPQEQDTIRGALLQSIDADCPSCKGGSNLEKARRSVRVIAEMLAANHNYVVWSLTGFADRNKVKGVNANTLWKYTLVAYNAGPGCYSSALKNVRTQGNNSHSWRDFSKNLDKACEDASDYVDAIANDLQTADPARLAIALTDQSLAGMLAKNTAHISQPTAVPLLTATPTVENTSTPTTQSTASLEPTISSTPTPGSETTTSTVAVELSSTLSVENSSVTPVPTFTLGVETISATAEMTSTLPVKSSSATVEITSSVAGTATPTPTNAVESSATATFAATAITSQTVPSSAGGSVSSSTAIPDEHTSGEIIVRFQPVLGSLFANSIIDSTNVVVEQRDPNLGITILSAPEEEIPQILDQLNSNLAVDFAEPNYVAESLHVPSDPYVSDQTNLDTLQLPIIWDTTKGNGITVAVIDTGMDVTHPDLTGALWTNSGETGTDANGNDRTNNGLDDDGDGYVDDWMGWNFVSNNNDIRDDQGHGTQIAGILAARADNNIGITGVAPESTVMALKALDVNGRGSYVDIAGAITYAVDHGAKIINLSLGGTASSQVLESAIQYATSRGVLVVAAAGNTGSEATIYPAMYDDVLAVSSVDADRVRTTYSTFGSFVDLAAPGNGIYSTLIGGDFGILNGTSTSAAQVSGIAALLATQPQYNTADKIRSALTRNAVDLGATGWDSYYGAGLVQAMDALNNTGVAFPTPTNVFLPTGTPTSDEDTIDATADTMAQEVFYASAQTSPGTIVNPTFSLGSVAGNFANSSSKYAAGGAWTITDFAPAATSYASIYSATLSIRFYQSGWSNDEYQIQYSVDGTTWNSLNTFDATNGMPTAVTTYTYDVSNIVNTAARVNGFQARILGSNAVSGADTVNIFLDWVSLTVVQNTAPSLTITSPGNLSTFVQGRAVTFSGSATDPEQGNLTGNMQWSSSINGALGSGGSFVKSNLSIGTHTITVTVQDNRGLSAAATQTISIVTNTVPVVAITSPGNNSIFARGTSVLFAASAADANDGDLGANVTWLSDIDGPIGTGAALSFSGLTPGTHLITASVADLDGATSSASITVLVTPIAGPHGKFNGSTDQCATCHRSHSAQSAGGDLLTSSQSAFTGNEYCLSCHGSGANAVSTHSNIDGKGKQEANFELLCVQCHDPHGTSNIFTVRTSIVLGALPTTFDAMTSTTGPVAFTSLKNADSFDEVDSPEDTVNNADDVCVTCHVNTANPGYPVSSHTGGSSHVGLLNYTGQSCIYCHPHSSDTDSATKDGFMPVRGSCQGCHSIAQGTRRAIVGGSGDFVRSSHHVTGTVTDADCVLCHDQSQHMAGKVRLFNVDSPVAAGAYVLDGSNDAADYESFCLSCHDSNGAKGDNSPFSDNVNMAGTSLQLNTTGWGTASHNGSKVGFGGSCMDCHDNGHGSNKIDLLAPYNATNTGRADDPMNQEEYFCYSCHKSGGTATTDVMTNYTRPTHWVPLGVNATNNLNLNDRHDISTTDQTTGAKHSGAKVECVSCHNPHTDNTSMKVIADPDPSDGRVPGGATPYFTQGTSATDFWSEWCLDCHDGSYPSTITAPTNALTNVFTTMSVDTHGAASGNVGSLEAGFGYTVNTLVQCRACHGTHVQGPTPVTSASNLFSVVLQVKGLTGVAIPTDGGSFQYELTNNSLTTTNVSGYEWCQTCHTGSMGTNKTNCYSCHYHGNHW